MDNEISSQDSSAAVQETPGAAAEAAPKRATRTRRKTTQATDTAAAAQAGTEAAATEAPATEPVAQAPAKKAPVRRSRAKKVAEPEAAETPAAEAAVEAPAAKAPAKRAPRRRATAPVASPAEAPAETAPAAADAAVVDAAAPAEDAAAKAPAKRPTRSRAKKAAPAEEAAVEVPAEAEAAVEAVEDGKPAKAPARSRSRRLSAADRAAEAAAEAVQAAAEAAAAEHAAEEAAANEAPAVDTAAVAAPAVVAAAEAGAPAQDSLFLAPSLLFQVPDLSLAVPVPAVAEEEDEESEEGARRRSSRSRSRKGRGRAAGDEAVEPGTETESEEDETEEAGAADDGVTSRRRRRRRRGDADLELTGGSDEDPPNTITKVRAPRQLAEAPVNNRVTSLRGSTRLEAKKQRRRESRDSGRRRQVITEAEFLARRESVDRTMVVRQGADRIQIGVLEDGILAEHFVSKTLQDSLIGNVYLGKVQNVLPSMEAAFVDIGRGRNAVLYAGEVNWDATKLNGQPRRIENALKSGDSVLVQVSKDPVGHKGARLTSQISLPGRYLVYVPGGSMTGISRKLPDVERNRLKRILKDHLPESAGVIVRTAAEGASEEELTHDINRLRAQWEGIQSQTNSTKMLAPEMLYGEPDLTIKVVRDVFNEDFTKLIVSGDDAWDTIEAYVTYVAPDLVDRLEKWTKPEDIFAAHRIDEQINKALERKVFLPSGGSLVIDRTEAMTVVDVNTGKFTGSGGNLEETVTKNNLEAAEEVVRQLRLRDIGGIIVIDFIDMVLESNRDLVLRRLVECLGRDRTKHQVAEVTSLGLVQMTRKRMGTGLLEVFGEQCETCAGRGMVTHEVPVEHRRAHTVAAEAHHPNVRGDHGRSEPAGRSEGNRTENRNENRGDAGRGSRNERKRSRGRQPVAEVEAAPAVHEEPTDAEKATKANAARAALAAVAAATAASHHEDHHDAAHAVQAPAANGTHAVQAHAPAADGTPMLTFGDEAVELPRGDRQSSEAVADRSAVLADLAQALDQLSGVEADGGDHEAQDGAPQRSSRSRRGRRRSASRAQGAANANEVTHGQDTPAAAPAALAAAPAQEAPKAAPAKAKPASEPIILGVGVPASEL
ncbi:Rne/Rng family ribonuclease [Pseudarthrobacter sp. P1]|uniref:Rne/Rng family ribonuclease n=1 Tax=Pseudarthrobacter sp. P1 TaxID=3418418 RepID=UPI003CF830DF